MHSGDKETVPTTGAVENSGPATTLNRSVTGNSSQQRSARRVLRNRLWVRFADGLARLFITTGGVGTIVAVTGVFVFLTWVAIPLFREGTLALVSEVPLELQATSEAPVAGGESGGANAGDEQIEKQSDEIQQGKTNRSANGSQASQDSEPDRRGVSETSRLAEQSPASLMVVSEYGTCFWTLSGDGRVSLYGIQGDAQGHFLHSTRLWEEGESPCWAFDERSGRGVLGYENGKIRFFSLQIAASISELSQGPPSIASAPADTVVRFADGVAQKTAEGQLRVERLELEVSPPNDLSQSPIIAIDLSLRGEDPTFAAMTADGTLYVESVRKTTNLLTGEENVSLTGGSIVLENYREKIRKERPRVLLTGALDNVFVLWRDGQLLRFDVRNVSSPQLAEEISLLGEQVGAVTVARFLIGKTTLLVGDDRGRISGWFTVKRSAEKAAKAGSETAPSETGDGGGGRLLLAHTYPQGNAAVADISVSQRSRVFAVSHADGTVRLLHGTAEQLVAQTQLSLDRGARLSLTPKEDLLVAIQPEKLSVLRVNAPHSGITLQTVFGKVWYEGMPRPEFVWQSSSGTDEFEPKYSLIPLIFGTLKATFFAMLFAIPVALPAAVYSSEFVHPVWRSRVKATIELMAGLPSVVLGFIAALVLAPWIESRLSFVLAVLFCVPVTCLIGGHLWSFLSRYWVVRLERFRFGFVTLFAILGVVSASWLGPWAEKLLFPDGFRQWLDSGKGSGTAGWMIILLPASSLLAVWLISRAVMRPLGSVWAQRSSTFWAGVRLIAFLAGAILAVLLAWCAGWFLATVLGLDPRGSLMGTYIQRNAFVVGLVMGFAIIPIIYTIAEDAISAVPGHLRAASLGCGATPWQTAVRVVIPTATSGLFSAIMIGLGRAAGETMIVLMAAGNTPILEWNIFNGFRTLSANIAVELPEAVQNSIHYRMLFLAALSLFVITFIVNTAAETVRLRFRKRAAQL